MTQQVLTDQGVWTPGDVVEPGIENRIAYSTKLGVLYEGDTLKLLAYIRSESIDTVFADPPFNLSKVYGSRVNDNRSDEEHISWCKKWIDQCIRVVRSGGAIFIYNLPKWNIILGNYLNESGMIFRHWIAVNIKLSLPIPGRLYPSHYSLLYFTKGKPRTFRKIRTPIEICRHCGKELKDYGGHRGAMNPNGVNLTDVWNDITPVRHWKFKSRKRSANQLSTKLLERVVQMSTQECDIVLDPFGGSGTTYDVCERLGRHWIGMEIESCDVIIERLQTEDLSPHKSKDYIEG
ncbi:MAG: site-specific DNA-methyltransferase [Deltaproteobacteria bacterium]|nr:site-specific DNA-methyltransferase [Deltaproteobacteria bacterium]